MNYRPLKTNFFRHPAMYVFAVGVLLRFFSCYNSHLFNPDGMLYIQQAKDFFYKGIGAVLDCYPYYNTLPVFITAFYKIFGDWVIAAKAVSMVFGIATMIPLYLLLRRFLDDVLASCTLLLFAVNPYFVALSCDVIRGPIYWFFITLGLYFFTSLNYNKNSYYMTLSCVAFIVAACSRVEAVLFLIVSPIYLLFSKIETRWQKLFFFVLPPVFIVLSGLLALFIMNLNINKFLYLRPIFSKIIDTYQNYGMLRDELSWLGDQNFKEFHFPYFWREVRNLLWWLGLGSLLNGIIRVIFEPLFIFFILGFIGLKERFKKDINLRYLILGAAAALLILYLQVINCWFMSSRFIPLFLIPAFVILGFGLARFVELATHRLNLGKKLIVTLLCLLILIVSLPKNMQANRKDKLVFQEIGDFVASREGNSQENLVVGSFKRIAFVYFFANVNYAGSGCILHINIQYDPKVPFNISMLRERGVKYLVWDEKNRTDQELEQLRSRKKEVIEMGKWRSDELGKLVLFKLN
jgi:4-amino-4-deoxy-L-arabinose transferase-like glycosyltransferase